MPVYVIALLTIYDRERYQRYASKFGAVLAKFGGELLAADERPLPVEGTAAPDKVVVIGFPDRESFERWSASDEYARIARDRIASTRASILCVRRLPRGA